MHILRILVGALFAGHGAQKLFGWFGGGGPAGTGRMFESAGLAPGKRNALMAGAAEVAGGGLLAAGVARPAAAAALNGSMITAIRHVHLSKGLWNHEGGFEYNLVLLASIFAAVSEEDGLPWALAALGAGAAGSFAASELGRREAERAEEIGPVPAKEPPVTQPVAPVV